MVIFYVFSFLFYYIDFADDFVVYIWHDCMKSYDFIYMHILQNIRNKLKEIRYILKMTKK